MLDLDHFKKVNDRFGHEGGDVVLHESAVLISELLRSYDIFGRLGGEEFGILLPDTDLNAAEVIAGRILEHLRGHQFASPLDSSRVTASIGVAAIADNPDGLEQLIRSADRNLYQAKRNGRDRVCR